MDRGPRVMIRVRPRPEKVHGTVRIVGSLMLRNDTNPGAVNHAVVDIEQRDVCTLGRNSNGWAAWTARGVWVGYCDTKEHAYRLCHAFLRMRGGT